MPMLWHAPEALIVLLILLILPAIWAIRHVVRTHG